jgi:1-acyl-sn-glycerol-3-phosphate acyltransferase
LRLQRREVIVQDFDLKPAADIGLTPLERWRSPRRESGLGQTVGHLLFAFATRTFLRIWNRLEIRGQENLPREPPFIMVANHASHLDALVLAAPLPYAIRDRVFPLAAGDVFFQSAAVSAFAAGFINAIPLWRKQKTPKALQELRQRLVSEPCVFLLFPEGARTRDGNYLRFKPGVGMLVAGSNVPVVPCHLRGTFEACPAGRILPLPRKITTTIGQPLRFPNVENNREGWDIIIGQVEKAIRDLGERGA